jgi:hypothetical protein
LNKEQALLAAVLRARACILRRVSHLKDEGAATAVFRLLQVVYRSSWRTARLQLKSQAGLSPGTIVALFSDCFGVYGTDHGSNNGLAGVRK